MFNAFGKTLVLLNLAASMMALTWAAAISARQHMDFGWKEPRKDMDSRSPPSTTSGRRPWSRPNAS